MDIKKAEEEDKDKRRVSTAGDFILYVWKIGQGLFKFRSDIQFTMFDKVKDD